MYTEGLFKKDTEFYFSLYHIGLATIEHNCNHSVTMLFPFGFKHN